MDIKGEKLNKNFLTTASMIAMIVVGFVILVMFAVWDPIFASRPVIAARLLRNRSVVLASWIGFFDFVIVPSSTILTYYTD